MQLLGSLIPGGIVSADLLACPSSVCSCRIYRKLSVAHNAGSHRGSLSQWWSEHVRALAALGNAGGIFMPWTVGWIAGIHDLHLGLAVSAIAPLLMLPLVLGLGRLAHPSRIF